MCGGDTVILAHGDLDGLTAAAVIIAALKNTGKLGRWEIRFAQPFALQEELRRLPGNIGRLIIVDIAVDEEHWASISRLLDGLEAGCKIWVDHHKSTLRHAAELIDKGFSLLVSLGGCAATLAGEAFLHLTGDVEFYRKLVVAGEVGDKVRELQPGDPLKPVVEVLGNALAAEPTDDLFKRRLVRMWVEARRVVDDEVARRAQEAEEKLRELLKEAGNSIVYDGSRVRVIDLRERRVHGYAGKIASYHSKESGKVVLLMFRVGQNNVIVTARVPEGLNVDVSALIRELAPRFGGGGGGHPKAASARLPTATVDDFVKELIARIESS